MPQIPSDLAKARIMISNDDGIHSQGIKVLEECIISLGSSHCVVAPESEQSAAGHSLTIHRPLRIQRYDDNHYSVYGTPTDCVVMGLQHVMKDAPPDLVVSGINHGKNAADDVTYSGTIAVAIEATLLGCPAIAFSQHIGGGHGDINWESAKTWVPKVLKKLAGFEIVENTLLNVNLPRGNTEPKGIIVVPQGHYEASGDDVIECMDPRGRKYFWIGPPQQTNHSGMDYDAAALESGYITITPLTLNLTHHKTLEALKEKIGP
ncbi:MAG: 5'/3'-nucleotidase SurE [Alphaproteobacteria bacterium]|nr:MAG: 5'/3'-nucleotidase SurE [Alphaproteobacteria bacterium]